MNKKYEEMQPWQQRVMDELTELDIKIKKLHAFLCTYSFNSLADEDKRLLNTQYFAMSTYREILEMRINRF